MKTVIIEDKQRIESIILHCDACFVGITDLEGNPYVVPMNFGYENGIIYLAFRSRRQQVRDVGT